jgi:hypothetical protein
MAGFGTAESPQNCNLLTMLTNEEIAANVVVQ